MTTSTSSKTPNAGPAATFFDELASGATSRCCGRYRGTFGSISCDGADTDSWLVAIDKGDLTVTREAGNADCIIRGERAVFDEVVKGRSERGRRGPAGGVGMPRRPRAPVRDPADLPGPATWVGPDCRHAEGVMSDEMVKILNGNTFVVSDHAATSRHRRPTPPDCSPSTPGTCRSGGSP